MSIIDLGKYAWLKQRRTWMCIPAAIENVLVYLGERGWPQERILGEWYLWRTGDGLSASDLHQEPDGSWWERYLITRLELESPARALNACGLGAAFDFRFLACATPVEAIDIMEARLAQPEPLPTIAPLHVPSGNAHMVVVIGIDHHNVRFHDPAGTAEISDTRAALGYRLGSIPHILTVDRRP